MTMDKSQGDPPVDRPDPEDLPTGTAESLDDDFDPADAPSNPDLVGPPTKGNEGDAATK